MAGDDRQRVMTSMRTAVEKACVRIAVNVHAELVERTPVDTGWARANWVPSLSVPWSSTVGSPDAFSTSTAESQLVAVLAFTFASGAIFVSNNVPYIRRLDAGHSTQAPAGFVRMGIDAALRAEVTP